MKPTQPSFQINTAKDGFYKGFNPIVALGSKSLICLLIFLVAVSPKRAATFLEGINGLVNTHFRGWYIYVMAFFIVVCLVLACLPKTGRIKLGAAEDVPDFSRFSWFSMLFGAGIGIGMMTYAVAEPLSQLSHNPDIIRGSIDAGKSAAARKAFQWSFLHYGVSAWGCYTLIGLALAVSAYRKNLPLTIRTALEPLMGRRLSGGLGHIIDIIAVLAAVSGIAIAIGFGVAQFASGLYYITGYDIIVELDKTPTMAAMFVSLIIIMGASTLSALSGVGRGIKWLSNINMVLSFVLLAIFLLFGTTVFIFKSYFIGIWDYVLHLPDMVTHVYPERAGDVAGKLASWQSAWTIFYWAWWIAFAPFVGLFFARISKGRSVREYVLGAMIVPSLMCFVWLTVIGGTAINLEQNGTAQGAIVTADLSNQLFATINVLFSGGIAKAVSVIVVILLMTFLVTSADSAILVINTIIGAGRSEHINRLHTLFWGGALAGVIGVLLLAGGLEAIGTAMIIGALPFSLVMALMAIAVLKALIFDEN